MASRLSQRLHSLLPANTFVKGVVALSGGTIGAQLIAIAVSPILTRLYTPDVFGVASVFLGLSTIFSILATWRYEIAIPQADSDTDAADLAALCAGLSLAMFVASAVIVWLFGPEIVAAFHLETLGQLIWLVPFFILVTGFYQLLTYWNYRQHAFSVVSKSLLHKNGWMSVGQVVGCRLEALGLLGGQLAGQILATIYLFVYSRGLFRFDVSREGVRRNALRFKKYPIFSTWSGVLGGAAWQVPILMFAALFSPVEAGLYSLAYRVVNMPTSLLGNAITSVFLPHAADAHREQQLGGLLTQVHDVLARIGLPAAIVMGVVAPVLFSIVFGHQWHEAGLYVQLLAVMLYANFMYTPISTSFGIMDRQDVGLWLHVGLLAVSVASVWAGAVIWHSVLVAVALYSISRAALYAWALCWIHRAVGNSVNVLLRPVGESLLRSLPALVCLLGAVSPHLPWWVRAVLAAIAAGFLVWYYIPLLRQLRRPATIGAGSV